MANAIYSNWDTSSYGNYTYSYVSAAPKAQPKKPEPVRIRIEG